jgi:predicted nuclease of predicted toxin-antitoxin system
MSHQSRLLAIDASVLRSAGGREQGHSAHCSKVLDAVRVNGHRAAFCAATSQEWNKHQSYFASKWRSGMLARKQMVLLNTKTTQTRLQGVIDAQPGLPEKARKALEKDIHMLALAMDADKILITGDAALKKLTLLSNITPALEWLVTLQNDSELERNALIERLHELAKNKPHPPLPP